MDGQWCDGGGCDDDDDDDGGVIAHSITTTILYSFAEDPWFRMRGMRIRMCFSARTRIVEWKMLCMRLIPICMCIYSIVRFEVR